MDERNDIFFICRRNPDTGDVELYLYQRFGGAYVMAEPPLLGHTSTGIDIGGATPTLSISQEDAQRLINELWMAGFRPSTAAGDDALKATQAHLEDMRKIAFALLMDDLTAGDVDQSGATL